MLDRDREQRLSELFGLALDLPQAERTAFVERLAAEDPELAVRLEDLLAEDARGTRGVLAGNALGEGREPTMQIGHYRLVRLLGEGGMGSVHLAEQDEPVQRTVALKTIRLGGGAEVLARFDAERQALARLTHPNIARIYETGATDSGLPWFAMEYCPGRPLDEHCDHQRLAVGDRLRLLLPVFDAVQHAHLRGILHRDLKPANVLVTQGDGREVPKVIDFGLARAVAGTLSARIRPSDDDRPLGTWRYISPEQADPRGDVDARADVWALGAMLYELLCGEPPFPGDTVAAVAARLASEEPVAPSRRLAGLLPERAQAVAAARRSSPAALARSLRGDLDAIALRALERNRARRYATPSELAADIRHHLACQPVSAVTPTPAYLLGKLVRRRKGTTALASIAVAFLVLAGGYGWLQAARARDSESALRAQLERMLTDAAARTELWQILLIEDPDLPLRQMLTSAEPAIAGMHRNDPLGEAGLRRSLSWTWLELGESEPARVQAQRAWDLVESSPQAGAVERFLTLESLVRATRAGGGAVPPLLASECVDLAMGILAQERPALARALMELHREARSAGVAERTVDEQIDEVALELERDLASALPDDLRRAQQSLLVTRALTEAAVVLNRAGRTQESERLSRKLERLAERTLEPGGSAWLFFLWRAADAHLRATPPLAGRAEELALRLQEGCRRRDFPTDHWMFEAARDLIEEARSVQAGAEQ